jgi:cell division protein FtsX
VTRPGAAVVAAALLCAGCGGRPHAREVDAKLASPRGCVVHVFFAASLMSGRRGTQREVRSVRSLLVASSRVRTFAFVSKRLALRRMRLRHPELFSGLPGNPLPPSYEIVPRSRDDAAGIEDELRNARGVEHVSATQAC